MDRRSGGWSPGGPWTIGAGHDPSTKRRRAPTRPRHPGGRGIDRMYLNAVISMLQTARRRYMSSLGRGRVRVGKRVMRFSFPPRPDLAVGPSTQAWSSRVAPNSSCRRVVDSAVKDAACTESAEEQATSGCPVEGVRCRKQPLKSFFRECLAEDPTLKLVTLQLPEDVQLNSGLYALGDHPVTM